MRWLRQSLSCQIQQRKRNAISHARRILPENVRDIKQTRSNLRWLVTFSARHLRAINLVEHLVEQDGSEVGIEKSIPWPDFGIKLFQCSMRAQETVIRYRVLVVEG